MKRTLLFVLVLTISIIASAQTYPELGKFYNWGISLEGNLNFRDDNSSFGRLIPKNTPSFSVGYFYEFNAQNHWSFLVGLDFNYYKVFDFENPTKKSFSEKSHYFSVPLLLQYKTKVASNVFLATKTGLYIDLNRADEGSITNTNVLGEVIDIEYEPDYCNYSLLFSVGAIFDFNYFLLGTDILFSYFPSDSKTSIWYQEGYIDKYDVNGNYLGARLSFKLKKFKI